MASEEDSQSTEWVMVSDLVQCMLCYGTIKQGKVLSGCKHMFCFDCLLHWWEDSADSNMKSVACPTCRVQCALPTEGKFINVILSNFTVDIFLSQYPTLTYSCFDL